MAIVVPAVGDTGTAAWADSVANQLNQSPISINGASNVPTTSAGNKLQSDTFTAVFSSVASVSGTLTYPVAFTTAPVIIATVVIGSNLDLCINWTSAPGTTTAAWRVFQKDGSAVSGTATVHWIAIGT